MSRPHRTAGSSANNVAGKPGLYTLDGPDHCGVIQIDHLGLKIASGNGAILTRADYVNCLRPRVQNTHKGSNGSLAVIGGAQGMIGAAILAARAGLQLGAGRVFVGTLTAMAVDFGQAELMWRSVDDALENGTALVLGPGLGLSTEALAITRRVTSTNRQNPAPLLLDADALSLIGAHPVLARNLARRNAPTVLTPHPAEAARLLLCETKQIQADRVGSALKLARQFNAVVALKGCGTVVANPDGRWRINTLGNPGLATGGTGDVLAGMRLSYSGAWSVHLSALPIHASCIITTTFLPFARA